MKRIRLVIIFYFTQGIIHNLGHPITPAFVRSLGIPDFMFGVFFATMSFGLMIGGPLWGALGDKGKKKRYIVIGLLMYSLGQFFFGFVGNQYWMVFFRFFSGFGVVATITYMPVISLNYHRKLTVPSTLPTASARRRSVPPSDIFLAALSPIISFSCNCWA